MGILLSNQPRHVAVAIDLLPFVVVDDDVGQPIAQDIGGPELSQIGISGRISCKGGHHQQGEGDRRYTYELFTFASTLACNGQQIFMLLRRPKECNGIAALGQPRYLN